MITYCKIMNATEIHNTELQLHELHKRTLKISQDIHNVNQTEEVRLKMKNSQD